MVTQQHQLQNVWCLVWKIHSINLQTYSLLDQVMPRNFSKNPISDYPYFCRLQNLIGRYLAHQTHPWQHLDLNCLCFEEASLHFEALSISLLLHHQGWVCPREQSLSFTKLVHLLWLLADRVWCICSYFFFTVLSHVRSPSSGFRFYVVKLSALELHLLLLIRDSSFLNPI